MEDGLSFDLGFLGESGILLQRVPRLYLEIFGQSKIEFVRRSKLHVRAFFSKSRPILMSATEKGTYISLDFRNHNLIVARLKSSSYRRSPN